MCWVNFSNSDFQLFKKSVIPHIEQTAILQSTPQLLSVSGYDAIPQWLGQWFKNRFVMSQSSSIWLPWAWGMAPVLLLADCIGASLADAYKERFFTLLAQRSRRVSCYVTIYTYIRVGTYRDYTSKASLMHTNGPSRHFWLSTLVELVWGSVFIFGQ